jgi:hypothetical protein
MALVRAASSADSEAISQLYAASSLPLFEAPGSVPAALQQAAAARIFEEEEGVPAGFASLAFAVPGVNVASALAAVQELLEGAVVNVSTKQLLAAAAGPSSGPRHLNSPSLSPSSSHSSLHPCSKATLQC